MRERPMIRNVLLALAVICGLGGATLALAGFTAQSAAACDQSQFKGT
jgi:hypothetical protein